MEKKGSRSVQPAAKGLTSDSKKGQDGASGKLWPRGGRRREPLGGSLAAKGEPSRKPNPQRASKSFDNKRPRPRGTLNPAASASRTETARLEDEYEAELGSVFVPGSKKQSLNHLLNFNYVSYSGETRHQHDNRGSNANKMTANRLMLTRKHKYNKEHFLQANCQFVVNNSGDYRQYLNNPDALVDWSLIEQVNVQVSEIPSCPICLYPPVAAKMTRCGHVYCWSCVLHYLSLSDKTWRKCPICYESVHKQDLKSVISIAHNTFNVNNSITFKLMKRPRGSLIAYPATAIVKNDDMIFKMSDKGAQDVHSKLLVADQGEILTIVQREEDELKLQLLDNPDCPENCFIEQALVFLKDRKDAVLNSLNVANTVTKAKEENLNVNFENLEIEDSDGDDEDKVDINPDSLDISSSSTNQQASKLHYFYQASDGQHIYLHAINARMLEHTYGSLEMGPKTLTGRILEKEGGSMTEELRKRLRYLQHLPVTCQFEVAEIHLRSPVVSKDTLEYFNEQIEIRRKRRQRRAKDEKKREKRIADEENRVFGKYPIPNLHIESQDQFPCFERARTESECTPPSEGNSSVSSSLNVENEYAGPSFAKMLASAKKKDADKWPSLKESPAIATKLINVTGQKASSSSLFSVRSTRSDSDIESEDFGPLPPSTSLGDAIVQALQKAEENEVLLTEPESPVNGKKKKKKNRQKVLFTTNMAYFGK